MEQVIVFGIGDYFKKKKNFFSDHFGVVAFLDNNAEKSDKSLEEIPVYNPSEIHNLPNVPIYVMVSVKYVAEIVEQLLSLNVPSNMIRLGVTIPPAFNDFEEWVLNNDVDMSVVPKGISLKYNGVEKVVKNTQAFYDAMHELNKVIHPYIDIFSKMPSIPANRHWGHPFGKPIDRRYIEEFLGNNRNYITGDVVEIADNRYTNQFGHDINKAYALHVYGGGNTIKGNLATGEGIIENFCDCLICTQTLQFIFDLHSTVKNIYKILKPNGTALITVPGISQIDMDGYKNWGEAWRFTKQSLQQLFEKVFQKDDIQVESFGNVKTAICFLYGMCQEDLTDSDYSLNDEMYPVILTLVCKKKF